MSTADRVRQVILSHGYGSGYNHVSLPPDLYSLIEACAYSGRFPEIFSPVLKFCGYTIDWNPDVPNGIVRFHSPHKPFARNVKVE